AAPVRAPSVAAPQSSPPETSPQEAPPRTKSRGQPPVKAPEARDEDGDALSELARVQSVIEKVGDRLGLEVWERVLERRLWRRVMTDSPLSALYRLYGAVGPLYAIGASPGWLPDEWGSWLAASYVDGAAVTVGTLLTEDSRCAYALRWRLADA